MLFSDEHLTIDKAGSAQAADNGADRIGPTSNT